MNDEQEAYFESKAVWLCARSEDVGTRNGRKLAEMAEKQKDLVHQSHAVHSRRNAKQMSSSAFGGLRSVINLVRGCRIVLSKNIAYLYGLANGTRGTFVGAVYGPGGIGTMPEALVVELPEYTGPPFYPEEPKWVPILQSEAGDDGELPARDLRSLSVSFALQDGHPLRLLRVEWRPVYSGSSTTRASGMVPMPPVPYTAPTNVPRVPLASPYW